MGGTIVSRSIPYRVVARSLCASSTVYDLNLASEDLTVGQKSSAKICVCRKSENALGTKSTHFSIFYVQHVHVPGALGTHLSLSLSRLVDARRD